MKIYFTNYFLFIILLLVSCDNENLDNNNTDNLVSKTTLSINNMSSYNIYYVEYGSVVFGNISNGKDITKEVIAGSRYVTFYLYADIKETRCRINQILTCEEGKINEITITNNTIITRFIDDNSNTLKNIFDILPVFYNIGDTGPGGGIVFFAQGGEYNECSGELGLYFWDTAMTIASGYYGGGFSDWYLPNNGELSLMYENLHKKGLGGFNPGTNYWSSTKYNSSSSYWFDFSSGYFGWAPDTQYARDVRAIRSFSTNLSI